MGNEFCSQIPKVTQSFEDELSVFGKFQPIKISSLSVLAIHINNFSQRKSNKTIFISHHINRFSPFLCKLHLLEICEDQGIKTVTIYLNNKRGEFQHNQCLKKIRKMIAKYFFKGKNQSLSR